MRNFNYIFTLLFVCFLIVQLYSQPQNEYISDVNTVLLLHLNETSGSIASDASSFGNHGTINGNLPSEGKFYGGMQFPSNNTDLGIVLPNSESLDISGALTVEAWIKTDNYEMAGTTIYAHNEYQLALGSFGSSGYLQFFKHVGNEWIIYQSDVQIPLNEWVHLAGVWDGTEASLFINGNQVNRTIIPNPYTAVGEIRVAAHYGSVLSPNTTTFIDEVRVSKVITIDVDEFNIVQLNSYILGQNYPNPFNPSTNIEYSISNNQRVTLKIYDILGKEIATLVDEFNAPGNYTVNFNAKNLSSGIYYFSIQAGNYVETKKMVLIK